MAWVTFEDLLAKGGATGVTVERIPFGPWAASLDVNAGALGKNETGAIQELYQSAREIMQQMGVPPDRVETRDVQEESGISEVQIPVWNLDTITSALNERGIKLAYDPSRDKGNWGSSRSHSIQLGVLDAAGNPVQEYRAGERSIGSGIFKEFIVPFASLALTANAGAIGAAIAPTASATVQSAIGSAVASGAGTALSGGDAEDVIKNALTGGAVGAASSLVKPYIQDAIDFVKDLTPGELGQIARGVDATAATGDVANNLAGIEAGGAADAGMIDLGADPLYGGGAGTSMNALAGGAVAGAAGTAATTTPAGYVDPLAGGAGFNYAGGVGNVSLAQLSPSAQEVYLEALRQGATDSTAMLRAITFNNTLLNEGLTSAAVDTSTNALLGGAAAGVGADVGGTVLNAYPEEGAIRLARYNDLRAMGMPHDVAFAQVASELGQLGPITAPVTGNIANALAAGDVVSTQVTPTERIATVETNALPERPLAGTTGAGVTDAGLGAAAAGAGAVGAAGAAGAAGAGAGGVMTEADLAGLDPNLTLGAGTDILGGTDATGGGVGAGAATGAITAGGAAATGLTGIKAVDDFLSYIGTPAGAAALGAFGSLAGGYLTGQAAKDAANIQAQSAQNALALQREQFEYQKGLLEPYRKAGESALGRLSGVMGLDGQPAQPQQLLDMDPGYAFRLGEGMKALERVQAARGKMLSGGAIKAGQRYAQDFASGEYGNAYNRLANIAGLGQTVGDQLGSAAQLFGRTAGETMFQGANALAAGRVGRTSGYMGGVGGAVDAFKNYQNQQQQNQLFRDIYGRMGN
jgi:hypothetical protein